MKDSKTRMNLTIEKDLKAEIAILAEQESRSLNSYIINAIKEYKRSRD